MNWNSHSDMVGKHAFLSASKYHWLDYDDEKLISVFENEKAKERGTRLHALAAELIELGQKLPRNQKTLNAYVNDAIAFKMSTEVMLVYSKYCFGTADAISFNNNKLQIHDLKTGVSPTNFKQLLIYAALFCLEYHQNPKDISVELRIYQNDEVRILIPTLDQLTAVINKAVSATTKLSKHEELRGYS